MNQIPSPFKVSAEELRELSVEIRLVAPKLLDRIVFVMRHQAEETAQYRLENEKLREGLLGYLSGWYVKADLQAMLNIPKAE